MSNINSLSYENDYRGNSRLYEFLAANYGISDLANKIYATKNAQMNILNLKRRMSSEDITTA